MCAVIARGHRGCGFRSLFFGVFPRAPYLLCVHDLTRGVAASQSSILEHALGYECRAVTSLTECPRFQPDAIFIRG